MKLLAGIALAFVLTAGIAGPAISQTLSGGPMPYTAIHHPEFVAAAATFPQDDDILLGRLTERSPSTSACRPGKPWPGFKSAATPWPTRSRTSASRVSSTTAWGARRS